MNAFASTHSQESRQAFGLFYPSSNRRVPLPLKSIDARFEIAGDCAQVVIEQIFEFDGPNAVDVTYTFPLPAGAAVHHCEMRVGDRKISAVAKPVEEARADAAAAKALGHRTALVEAVRDNLFELQLGNVQPGDVIAIRLSYFEPLAGDGSNRRLRIPTCPGVRYVPGIPEGADGATDLVPDAGRLNPPRIAATDPDAAVFFCAGKLLGVRNVISPSHRIGILPITPDGRTPVMIEDDESLPDHDFILDWQTTEETLALASAEAPGYLLCSVRVPTNLPHERAPRDVFFLLDASGSMEGSNWDALVRAVKLALGELAPSDRVALTLFANSTTPLTKGLLPATPANVRKMLTDLLLHSPGGGTEFTAAFAGTIREARNAKRPVIVVITDGQFGDEGRACAEAAGCGIEVHTFGIDANVNEAVLNKIARRTRGTCTLCLPDEELGEHIRTLAANLTAPCLDSVTAGGDWKVVGNPPALRAEQSGLVPFRRPDCDRQGVPASIGIRMWFSDGSQRSVDLPVRTTQGRAPALMAAKAEITALLDADQCSSAVVLACRHNLLCEGVAFVAIDGEERVAVATVEMQQPAQETRRSDMLMQPIFKRIARGQMSKLNCQIDYLINPDARGSRGVIKRFKGFLGLGNESRERRFASLERGSDAADDLRILAARVSCFGGMAWVSLLDKVLLPWANKNTTHARLLRRCLGDLAALPDSPDGRAEANRLLVADLVPFLPTKVGKAVTEFLCSADAG